MSRNRVVAILQARVGSSRLPGKVLADLGGQPLLGQIVRRLALAREIDRLVIATTDLPQDDQIEALATRLGVPCFRGAEEDVLDRYYQAARLFGAEVVVRVTGDNPLVDGVLVDWVVDHVMASDPPFDYVDTWYSRTFPVGLSVEVFSLSALSAAWQEDGNNIEWREHVAPFIYHHPERFRCLHLRCWKDYSHMRLTVDVPEDLALVRLIYKESAGDPPGWPDILAFLEAHPDWLEINRHVKQIVI